MYPLLMQYFFLNLLYTFSAYISHKKYNSTFPFLLPSVLKLPNFFYDMLLVVLSCSHTCCILWYSHSQCQALHISCPPQWPGPASPWPADPGTPGWPGTPRPGGAGAGPATISAPSRGPPYPPHKSEQRGAPGPTWYMRRQYHCCVAFKSFTFGVGAQH